MKTFLYFALISPARDEGFSTSCCTLLFCYAIPEENILHSQLYLHSIFYIRYRCVLHHNQKTKKETVQQSTFLAWERRLKPEVRRKLLLHVLSLKSQNSSQILVTISHKTKWILRGSRYIASNRSNYARMFAFLTATVYSVVREPSLRFPSAAMRSFSWNIHNSFPSPAPPYFRRTYRRATWHQRQWY